MAKILVVDDNEEAAASLQTVLSREGYLVDTVADGAEAVALLKDYDYDLIVLDWNLPGHSGPEVCRIYRSAGGVSPIIMLTGNSTENDKEFGLDSGADDYLTKPYSLKEFLARARALLRRRVVSTAKKLKVGNLMLDTASKLAFRDGAEIKLVPKEYMLLEFFMKHPDQVFSSEQILARLWHTDSESSTDALRTTLSRLRQKIAVPGEDSLIETVTGFGFKMRGNARQMVD
jgi:OmpR-family two-component system manganese-sensing response regulator